MDLGRHRADKRSRGRSPTRWTDDIKRITGCKTLKIENTGNKLGSSMSSSGCQWLIDDNDDDDMFCKNIFFRNKQLNLFELPFIKTLS